MGERRQVKSSLAAQPVLMTPEMRSIPLASANKASGKGVSSLSSSSSSRCHPLVTTHLAFSI